MSSNTSQCSLSDDLNINYLQSLSVDDLLGEILSNSSDFNENSFSETFSNDKCITDVLNNFEKMLSHNYSMIISPENAQKLLLSIKKLSVKCFLYGKQSRTPIIGDLNDINEKEIDFQMQKDESNSKNIVKNENTAVGVSQNEKDRDFDENTRIILSKKDEEILILKNKIQAIEYRNAMLENIKKEQNEDCGAMQQLIYELKGQVTKRNIRIQNLNISIHKLEEEIHKHETANKKMLAITNSYKRECLTLKKTLETCSEEVVDKQKKEISDLNKTIDIISDLYEKSVNEKDRAVEALERAKVLIVRLDSFINSVQTKVGNAEKEKAKSEIEIKKMNDFDEVVKIIGTDDVIPAVKEMIEKHSNDAKIEKKDANLVYFCTAIIQNLGKLSDEKNVFSNEKYINKVLNNIEIADDSKLISIINGFNEILMKLQKVKEETESENKEMEAIINQIMKEFKAVDKNSLCQFLEHRFSTLETFYRRIKEVTKSFDKDGIITFVKNLMKNVEKIKTEVFPAFNFEGTLSEFILFAIDFAHRHSEEIDKIHDRNIAKLEENRTTIQDLNQQIKDEKDKSGKLEDSNSKFQKEVRELEKKMNELVNENNKIGEESQSVYKNYEDSKTKEATAVKENIELKENNKEMREKIEKLTNENEKLNDALNKNKEICETKYNEILENEREAAKESIEELKKKSLAKETELKKALKHLKQQYNQYKKEMDAIVSRYKASYNRNNEIADQLLHQMELEDIEQPVIKLNTDNTSSKVVELAKQLKEEKEKIEIVRKEGLENSKKMISMRDAFWKTHIEEEKQKYEALISEKDAEIEKQERKINEIENKIREICSVNDDTVSSLNKLKSDYSDVVDKKEKIQEAKEWEEWAKSIILNTNSIMMINTDHKNLMKVLGCIIKPKDATLIDDLNKTINNLRKQKRIMIKLMETKDINRRRKASNINPVIIAIMGIVRINRRK